MVEETTVVKTSTDKFSIVDEAKLFLKEMLKGDYLEEKEIQKNTYVIRTKPEHIRAITEYMIRRDARLVHITTSDEGIYGFESQYHFAFDHIERNVYFIIKINASREKPEFPSVSRITWQTSWAEREMMELLGVTFLDHPDPRRQFLAYEYPELPESEKVDGFSLYSKSTTFSNIIRRGSTF